jgi:acyl-CoA synthetase (AMP-forming)/AMP-acid ligase II
VDTGPNWPEPAVDVVTLSPVKAEDDALLMYTSGTTGNPKGVLLTHTSVLAGGANTAGAHELTDDDRGLCVLPLCHINAQMVTVFGPLVSGGSVTMPHRFSVSQFWSWVIDCECTWFSVVPTIISYLAHDQHPPRPERLAKVRFGRSASAPLPPALHAEFERKFGVTIVETMGLTETAAQILSNPMPPKRGKYGSPGLAYGNEVKIFDNSGNEVPAGEQGEIVVRGANVMRGYLSNPEATRASLDADGWLHTGDLGHQDKDGYVFVTGRLKELIIKGGENISPREIDDVLYSHPAVIEAGAVGVPDDHYGEDVVACVVVSDDIDCDEHELVEFCAARLGAFKAPRAVFFMSDLPKGPSGKVQRRKLVGLIKEAFPATV